MRARATASALCSPVARITIDRAARIVATPIVRARGMTRSIPPKSLAASARVTGCSSTSRVGSRRASATVKRLGSLKPMWPLRPMPEKLDVEAAVGLDPAVELRRVRGRERLGDRAVEHVRSVRGDVDVAE